VHAYSMRKEETSSFEGESRLKFAGTSEFAGAET